MKAQAFKIIGEFVQSDNFKKLIKKMEPEDLQDDLAAEVSLILLELNPELVIKLHECSQLNFYVTRIVFNTIKSSTSPFYKKFRHVRRIESEYKEDKWEDRESESLSHILQRTLYKIPLRTADEVDESQAAIEDKKQVEMVFDVIDTLDDYEMVIIKLYLQYGTYREVEKHTGIPYSSVFKQVKKAIDNIKEKIKRN